MGGLLGHCLLPSNSVSLISPQMKAPSHYAGPLSTAHQDPLEAAVICHSCYRPQNPDLATQRLE